MGHTGEWKIVGGHPGHSAVGGVILVIGKVWENSDDWEVFGSFRYLGSGWGHYGDWKGVDKFR